MMSKSRKHEGQSDCLSASDVPSAVEPIRVSALLFTSLRPAPTRNPILALRPPSLIKLVQQYFVPGFGIFRLQPYSVLSWARGTTVLLPRPRRLSSLCSWSSSYQGQPSMDAAFTTNTNFFPESNRRYNLSIQYEQQQAERMIISNCGAQADRYPIALSRRREGEPDCFGRTRL